MSTNNYRYEQIKVQYLESDFAFRTGRINQQEFSSKVVECLVLLLELYSAIYPYYNQLQKIAEDNWEKARTVRKAPDVSQDEQIPASIQKGKIGELAIKHQNEYFQWKQGLINYGQYITGFAGFLFDLLDTTGQIQPYLKMIEDQAEKNWKSSPQWKNWLLSKL